MSILYINYPPLSTIGSTPQLIYVGTNDTLATVTTAGYLNAAIPQYGNIFSQNQMVMVNTTDQLTVLLSLSISGGTITLVEIPATGAVTSISGTTNQITSSPTTGAVVLSIPSTFIAPGSIAATTTISGTTLNSSTLTASTALASDSSKNIVSSSTTATELGYVHGVTSAIQTQINAITSSIVTSVSGDGSTILVTPTTGAAVVSILSTYIGQASIRTLGIVTAGTWHAGIIGGQYGGTGVNNGGAQLTIANNVTFTGNHIFTGALTADTSVTFPTSGTLVNNTVVELADLAWVGTITTGTWAAAVINGQYGGTGVDNGGAQLTIGNNVTFIGNYTFAATLNNNTTVTFPVSGNLVVDTVTTLSDLASIGTIATGTWEGSIIAAQYGGTGVDNGAAQFTMANNVTYAGNYTFTGTLTGNTNVTFPTSGTLLTSAGAVTSIAGTANEITASASVGSVTLSITDNAVLPGTGGVTLPQGNTAARAGGAGTIRFNSQTTVFESTVDGSTWATIETSSTGVTSVSGTSNRITASPTTGAVVVDISASYVGQTSITTLGTITTGVWNGSVVQPSYGGTGIVNTGTITIGAAITFAGAYTFTGTLTNTTSVTFPTSGTLATTSQIPSFPLSPANGGTGVNNGTNTLTVGANSTINQNVSTSGTPTFSNVQLDSGGLFDTNSNLIIKFNPQASAVNYLLVTNNAATYPVYLQANGADTNINLYLEGKGNLGAVIGGTTAGDNAASGFVGEYISSNIASGSAVTVANTTATDITHISLTAGDWDVWGNITWVSFATNMYDVLGWINTTSATTIDPSLTYYISDGSGTAINAFISTPPPSQRISISSTTSVYLSCYTTMASGNATACGTISARRVR